MVNQTSAYVAGGVVPTRMGNAHPSLFPYDLLPTADRDLIIIATNDGQFRKLCDVLGLSDLPDDPRFAHNDDRQHNRDILRSLLVERLRMRTADEWFQALTAAGVACGPINTVAGGVDFASSLGLDPVVQVGTGEHSVPMIRNPITFSRTPPRYELPPPALGQDSDQVRAWLSNSARADERLK
jgi:crotonobetainyl-CoA:carnitine CoA-transferase CaiB-like acyl-CoA transferase